MSDWDESEHPRVPAGSSEGGQFTTKAAVAAWQAAGLPIPTAAKTYEEYAKEYQEIKRKAFEELPEWDRKEWKLFYGLRSSDWYQLESTEEIEKAAKQLGESPEEYIKEVESYYKEQLEASNVYMRITNTNLQRALEEGEFKNTYMTGKTKAGYSSHGHSYAEYMERRLEGEFQALGIPMDRSSEFRPIYGYWSQDEKKNFSNDWVEQYGNIVVKFDKQKIADSLTWTAADSLDNAPYIRSSDWRSPSFFSSRNATGNPDHFSYIFSDSPDEPHGPSFYWEAQIFDRSVSNIQEVVFLLPADKKPQSKTIKLLEQKGIKWRKEIVSSQ